MHSDDPAPRHPVDVDVRMAGPGWTETASARGQRSSRSPARRRPPKLAMNGVASNCPRIGGVCAPTEPSSVPAGARRSLADPGGDRHSDEHHVENQDCREDCQCDLPQLLGSFRCVLRAREIAGRPSRVDTQRVVHSSEGDGPEEHDGSDGPPAVDRRQRRSRWLGRSWIAAHRCLLGVRHLLSIRRRGLPVPLDR